MKNNKNNNEDNQDKIGDRNSKMFVEDFSKGNNHQEIAENRLQRQNPIVGIEDKLRRQFTGNRSRGQREDQNSREGRKTNRQRSGFRSKDTFDKKGFSVITANRNRVISNT